MIEELQRQLQEEIGEDELNKDELKILAQKYGLMVPQFTPSERNLIIRDERKQHAK